MSAAGPHVVAVSRSSRHGFSKSPELFVELLAGFGVAGDAHAGVTVQHLYDRRKEPARPNLRQVHLLSAELLEEVAAAGFRVQPGELGENVLTCGLDLLQLPVGTELRLGEEAVVALTGLRQPCVKIDRFQQGLRAAVEDRPPGLPPVYRAGVMAIVRRSGTVRPGEAIQVALPAEPHRALTTV